MFQIHKTLFQIDIYFSNLQNFELNPYLFFKSTKIIFQIGQVDSTEFAELPESAENHNILSSLIKQPKNYPWTYSDTFSQILSVKNNSNFIFLQFRIFICGPIPKSENAESAESFIKLFLLFQWYLLIKYRCLDT